MRMMILALLLAGAQAVYPQKFPDHLSASVDYWGTLLTWPSATLTRDLSRQWQDLHEHKLSKQDIRNLESVLRIADFQVPSLEKKDKQFLFKYGHLAIYLSGLNPEANDEMNRAGVWMLTYPDARRYGLQVNDQVDERRDVIKSTRAARLYFEDLKKIHGGNAESIFVMGPVAWQKSTNELKETIDRDLSVIRFIHRAFDTPDGVVAKNLFIEQTFSNEVLTQVVSKHSGQELETFKKVNPTLVGSMIPADYSIKMTENLEQELLVLETKIIGERRSQIVDSLRRAIKNDIPSPNTHQVVAYRVKSGDVLGRIAEHYGVSISKLKKWNDLRSDRIDIDQKLTIYLKKGQELPDPVISQETPKPEISLTESEKANYTIYEVQPGDTLWAISKQFEGVKPEQIMEWNNIGEDLSIGQKLKIKTQ